MKNSAAMIDMVRRCRLTSLINRQENRERERSRLYQIRRSMIEGYKEADSNTEEK